MGLISVPLVKRAAITALEIAVGLLCVGAAIAFARFVATPAISNLLPANAEAASLLSRGLTVVFIALGYWAFVRLYERRRARELAPALAKILIATLAGALMIGAPIAALYILGVYQLESVNGFNATIAMGVTIFVFAALEEFVFRGVVFQSIENAAGTVVSLVFVSALFGVLHIANDGATWLTAISVTLYGAMWTSVFILTRNIWAVTAHHAAWNYAMFLTGLPVSGRADWRAHAPFSSTAQGADLLTGAEFGPENSIVAIIFAAFCTLAILFVSRRYGKFAPFRAQGLQREAA